MTETEAELRGVASLQRERAPCKHCGNEIETDLAACPDCGNQPVAAVKRGSIGTMLAGAILAMTASNVALAYWLAPLVGVALFATGAGLYWVLTERYSPTEYDSYARSAPEPDSVGH